MDRNRPGLTVGLWVSHDGTGLYNVHISAKPHKEKKHPPVVFLGSINFEKQDKQHLSINLVLFVYKGVSLFSQSSI